MPTPFTRTMRSLKNDGFRRSLFGLFFGLILLGAWASWMFLTGVSIYTFSDRARLEVDTGVHSIADDAGFDALPSGAKFMGPDGVVRIKP